MKRIKELKQFLDSDDFTLFVFSGAKSEKQFQRIANSYFYRFLIYLKYRKCFQ